MIHLRRSPLFALAFGLVMLAAADRVVANELLVDDPAQPGMVSLNFPEQLDLVVLIDYIGKRQNINFIYSKQTAAKKVTIKAPAAVPADSVMDLFAGILQMNGLVIVETEVPGTVRIEAATDLTNMSREVIEESPDEGTPVTRVVTRVFTLSRSDAEEVNRMIAPFLSVATAKSTALKEQGILLVTDYVGNMERIEKLVSLADQPKQNVDVKFQRIEHMTAAQANTMLNQLMDGAGRRGDVALYADDRARRLILMGRPDDVAYALDLLSSIDEPLGTEMRVYRFEVVSPEKIDGLVKKVIGEDAAKRLYQSATDLDTGLLIATTTPEIHEQIDKLRDSLDQAPTDSQSPIRFYKLMNASADEVLSTLQDLEGDTGLGGLSVDGAVAGEGEDFSRINGPTQEQINSTSEANLRSTIESSLSLKNEDIGLGQARIFAHEASNTVIVVARPSMHPIYEKLIKRLDVRRPQVLIEATVVALDTTDGFELGVEILRAGEVDDEGRYLTFSSFGLSDTVDTSSSSPSLVLKPGVGFNGAILTADIADIVIRALDSDTRAKVVSRPSVLVNDNATGTLVSENEEPFSSVNASSTVSTTSFGGFAAAGTSIKVTPQISEGDHLKLSYEIELSSFTETSAVGSSDSSDDSTASADLPPARQTNSLVSEATIPDGHTIVVGGLTRETLRERIDRVPILGEIPILEYALSDRSKTAQQTTLFVFIHAVILRDDKFQDLKFVSGQASLDAELDEGFPECEPVSIP